MPNLVEIMNGSEAKKLDDAAELLEGTLLRIIDGAIFRNPKRGVYWIKKRAEYIKENYGKTMDRHVYSLSVHPFDARKQMIVRGYEEFMLLASFLVLEKNKLPVNIKNNASYILHNFILPVEGNTAREVVVKTAKLSRL